MTDFTQAATWNKCPSCGRPVPPNEWVSYMRCEDCWAGNDYNPPQAGIVVNRVSARGRKTPNPDSTGENH